MSNNNLKHSILRKISLFLILIYIISYTVPTGMTYAAETSDKNISIELEDYMFGSKLTGISRVIYDKLLVEASEVSANPIEVSLKEYNLADSKVDYIVSLLLPILDSIRSDFPYYDWIYLSSDGVNSTSSTISFSGSTISTLQIKPAISPYHGSATMQSNRLDMVNDKLNKLLLDMPDSATTRYKRLEYIHDYLTDTITYDSNALKASNNKSSTLAEQWGYAWEAYGALIKQSSVCEGYAKAFKLACDKLDIPCQLVSGYAGESHMWNVVQMEDGKWYAVDVTFDDPIYNFTPSKEQIERDKDTYFLVGSNTLNSAAIVHTAKSNHLTYPTLSKTDYNVSEQIDEPLVIYEGYLHDRYLGKSAAAFVFEEQLEEPAQPTINYTSKTIYVNKKVTLKFKNLSEKAVVTYKSLNPKIAKVSKKGKITGLRKGTATIRTTVKQNGETYTFKTKVKVKKAK